jgi:CBS domain-containing protein
MHSMNIDVPIKNLMTTAVMSVGTETLLFEANDILLKNSLGGLPVVSKEQVLLGMFSELDLSTKESLLHLPTLLKLFKEFSIYKKDEGMLWTDVSSMFAIKVSDVMNSNPLVLDQDSSVDAAVKLFGERRHTNLIPVVDRANKLVGVISRSDLIRFLGSRTSAVSFRDPAPYTQRKIDKHIDNFLRNFEKNFVLVSKYRTVHWFAISVLFTLVGFVIAFVWILQVSYSP